MLQRAAEILGGEDQLTAYLGVTRERLRIWSRSRFPLPDEVFLKLVDLISDPPPRKTARSPRRV